MAINGIIISYYSTFVATAFRYLGQGSDFHHFQKNAYNSKTMRLLLKKNVYVQDRRKLPYPCSRVIVVIRDTLYMKIVSELEAERS